MKLADGPRPILLLAAFVLAAVCAAGVWRRGAAADEKPFDLVIKNARVVDGSGNPWFRADVAVKGGRIARVGRVGASEGRRVIDAAGKVLAPGFIDVHTHVENIYDLPEAENFVRMGVTTLVTGNCGGSAVDVGRFLGRLKETPTAVNVATLVGHNSVRRAVFGEVDRAPTPEELEKMKALVERAMRDGAVGLSTGLYYVPGAYAKTDEVVELAKVAARFGGLYATHMRDEGGRVADSIRESIEIGERAGLPVEISHFKISAKRLWGQSDARARPRGAEARPTGHRRPVRVHGEQHLSRLAPARLGRGGRPRGGAQAHQRPRAARAHRARDEGGAEEVGLQRPRLRQRGELRPEARVRRQVDSRDHKARAEQVGR